MNKAITTQRLILRPWRLEDYDLFADLNSDARVMEHFPRVLSKEESHQFAHKCATKIQESGWGLWAVEVPDVADFIGFIGLAPINFACSFSSAIEVGWRLAHPYWGKGYAPEGALAALKYGYETLGLEEIVSMTAVGNQRSRRVMEKIGMYRDPHDDFDHPNIPEGHHLQRHVLYRLPRSRYEVKVSEARPENFAPRCEVAACYLEVNGKLLVMERALTQSEGKTWGVPAGKLESGEEPIQAAIRELYEETHIHISQNDITSIGTLYVQKPKISYVYHMFQAQLIETPEIQLSSEHTQYLWVSPQQIEQIPLIGGGIEALNYYIRNKRTAR